MFPILNSSGSSILHRLLLIISSLLVIIVLILLVIQKEVLFSLLLLGSIILFSITLYSRIIYRGHLIDKYYGHLTSLIGSLSLETNQKPFTQRKRYRSLYELEGLITALDASISKKTTELRNRNIELKKKQTEALKQNHELTLAYKALKESRDRYEKLVTNLEEEYFLYTDNLSGTLVYVSESVEKILGYSISEFKKKRNELFTGNPINKTAKNIMGQIQKGNVQPKFLVELYHINCSPRILEISEVPVFSREGILLYIEGIAHDITKRYNAEGLIREQEEKYRQVFDRASDFIFIYAVQKDNKPGKFIEANRYTQSILGYKHDELLQMTPDDLNAAEWNGIQQYNQGEKYERIWEAKDGNIINVEISEHSFKIKGKKACIAVARDITERKRAVEEVKFMNEELVNQKENLEALLDNLTQTQEQLVQSEKMAALGQLIAGVAHEINTPLGAIKASVGNLSDSLESALRDLPELFKSQSENNIKLFLLIFQISRVKKQELTSREKRERKRNIRIELKKQEIEAADAIADLLVYLDIYEGNQEFYELIKQPDALTVLRNARDFISLLKNTKTISIATDKASKVVFALKKYAHRDSMGEKVPTDIIDGIETVLTLYDNQLKQGITLIKDYKEIPLAMCYQDEINQVWTNLIQNGIQSMGQEGKLSISVRNDEKNIFVSVKDTGEGIDPGILDKIFDPFFTTKKQGEGSGLGLDIVKKIIDKHSGTIDVVSKIGEGATFIITLPII
jgi:PAS domain S-box-containing protein